MVEDETGVLGGMTTISKGTLCLVIPSAGIYILQYSVFQQWCFIVTVALLISVIPRKGSRLGVMMNLDL